MSDAEFRVAYDAEVRRLQSLERSDTGGGNFYNTTLARVGKRFASTIIGTTLEGRGSFSEAFHLLGFKKMSVLDELGRRMGGNRLMGYLLDANVFMARSDCTTAWISVRRSGNG